jgi:DNA-binding transcriptional ArsR family regulator
MVSGTLFERAEEAARFLAVLGNGKRLAILCLLVNGELSVGAIAERVQLSQSALSQHLAKLRGEELVATRRVRQTIFYSCPSERVREVLSTLDELFGDARTDRSALTRSASGNPSSPG